MLRFLLFALAAIILAGCNSGGGSKQTLTGAVATFLVVNTGARCAAVDHAQIVVRDDKDAIIATGKTGSVTTDKVGGCNAPFTLSLPTAKVYQIKIGDYVAPVQTYDELKQAGWYLYLIWT